MKILPFLFLLGISSAGLKAQQFQLDAAAEFNLPTCNASNRSALGFGAGLNLGYSLSNRLALSSSIAYNYFVGKKFMGYRMQGLSAFPLKVGLRYYTSTDFYFEGLGGVAMQSNTGNSSGAWSFGMGTRSTKQPLNFSIRYESWLDPNFGLASFGQKTAFDFIALRLAYQFLK